MASLTDLPGLAQQLLNQVIAELTAQGVPIPDRAYRQPGSIPVWDGEQITSGLMGITQGQPGLAFPQSYVPEALNLYATLFVLLVRPISVISTESFSGELQIPTAEQSDGDGGQLLIDSGALAIAASRIHGARRLTGPGEGFVIDGVQPLGPEGAYAANRLLVSLSLS